MRIPFFSKDKKAKEDVKNSGAKSSKKKTAKKKGKKFSGKVVVYSTKTCPWCAKTKEFLKANKISYTNKDVGSNKKNADEMMKKSGQQGVPVVVIGSKIIVGYNENKLRSALGL